jgi:hypothetical protein
MKFGIDIGGGHISIETFYRFREKLQLQSLINISHKYILMLLLLQMRAG